MAKKVHILYWMAKNLKIIDIDGNIVPLSLNFAQHRVHKTLYELQEKNNLPVRAIILKARRVGVSTYIEGRFFTEINNASNRYACICSADLDASNKVFKMAKLFQEEMKKAGTERPTQYSSRKEIVYADPHRSEFVVQTAGKQVLGRGGLTHYLHPTEVAFWQSAKEQLGGAVQEVPDRPGTMIILESTANGVGGAFYDMYQQAVEDWKHTKNPANYIPIFLPWYIFPDYQMKVPESVGFEIGKPHGNIPWEWVENEKELVVKYGLCNEQLFWRRWAIKNKCQGDLTLFFQEFPACSGEAFQSSGRNVFLGSKLEKMETGCRDTGTFVLEPVNNGIKVENVSQGFNCWRIWEQPKQECSYAVGVDTMEGRQADPNDVKSDFDCHGIQVLNRDTGEFVAEYHGRGNQREVGKQALYAAKMYNGAWIAPEMPFGMVALDVLKEAGYDRIYQRQTHDEQIIEADSDNLGWRTTIVTRPKMIEDFKTAVSEESIKINSKSLIEEMKSFVYNKEGRPVHLPSKHDDLLFAAMIALQLHLRLPLKPKPYEFESVFDEGKPERKEKSLAFHGGKDTWEPGAEDKEDMESSL